MKKPAKTRTRPIGVVPTRANTKVGDWVRRVKPSDVLSMNALYMVTSWDGRNHISLAGQSDKDFWMNTQFLTSHPPEPAPAKALGPWRVWYDKGLECYWLGDDGSVTWRWDDRSESGEFKKCAPCSFEEMAAVKTYTELTGPELAEFCRKHQMEEPKGVLGVESYFGSDELPASKSVKPDPRRWELSINLSGKDLASLEKLLKARELLLAAFDAGEGKS